MYSTPGISIIIATYNRPKSLKRLLNQINDQRCVNFNNIDVCIVDDGSDELFEVPLKANGLLFPPGDTYQSGALIRNNMRTTYVHRSRHSDGVARVYSARNLAAQKTYQPYILQLDDDVEFHPYLLNLLQSTAGLMPPDAHFVWTPRISNNIDVDLNDDVGQRGSDGRWFDGRVQWHETHWQSTDSSGMFMPRITWQDVGGYDEEFDTCMGAADQELALRVQKLGGLPGDVKVMIAPYFVNKADEETGSYRMEMIDRRTRPERNEDILARKHPDAKQWTNV